MNNSEQIYCVVRKTWVAALPEELVRQQLVSRMVHNLGYPSTLLTLEKGLRQVGHLDFKGVKIPSRRADLICYGKDIHPECSLYPLLLVECKSVKITNRMVNQVIGYNHYLKAPFIALVNGEEMRTGWFDKANNAYTFVPRLLAYKDLLELLQK